MAIKIGYTLQGILIGDVDSDREREFEFFMKDPAWMIFHEHGIQFVPFLDPCEESEICVLYSELNFRQLFTPKEGICKLYNEQFGPKIVIPGIVVPKHN